jgi:hypothetical protein
MGAAIALAVVPASALAGTQSASKDGITATLTFKGSDFQTTDLNLEIVRRGVTAYDKAVKSNDCYSSCSPLNSSGSVHILALQPGIAEPNVLVDMYSGGAHCCQIEQVFTYSATTKTYSEVQRDFGNYGEELVKSEGIWLFKSENNDFAYEFTDYAASGAPLQLFKFSDARKFVNVTHQHDKMIAADAKLWLKAYRSEAPHYSDSVGLIAAWAADEDELGKSVYVSKFLQQQAAKHHLNSAIAASGEKFIKALDKFLRQEGYLH